jgi:hypothetical protein
MARPKYCPDCNPRPNKIELYLNDKKIGFINANWTVVKKEKVTFFDHDGEAIAELDSSDIKMG